MGTSDPKSIEATAKSIGLEPQTTEDIIPGLMHDILQTVYQGALGRGDNELAGKCERLYEKWYTNAKMDPTDTDVVQSTAILGPPGHGKTTSFKVAAQRVAAGLGMRYLENTKATDPDVKVDRNDFVFITQETAGVVSAIEWMGLPTREEVGGGRAQMGRLHSSSLIKLQQAGGGVLLLDDFLNASPNIQNVGLSLTLEKRFNSLDLTNAYVGVTGNLGALDGTHTQRPSTALRNRLKMIFGVDRFDNWSRRVQRRFNDEMGDTGVVGFLERQSQFFTEEPDVKKAGGYATPRSWENLVQDNRRIIRRHGGRGNLIGALRDLSRAATAALGPEISAQLVTYYHSLAQSADPLARAIIMEGRIEQAEIDKRFKDGHSSNEQHFGYQFATALADYTVTRLGTEGKDPGNKLFAETIERFGKGIMPLNGNMFTHALNILCTRLAIRRPDMAEPAAANAEPMLRAEHKRTIGQILSQSPHYTAERRAEIISELSQLSRHTSTAQRRSSMRGK